MVGARRGVGWNSAKRCSTLQSRFQFPKNPYIAGRFIWHEVGCAAYEASIFLSILQP